MMTKEKKRREEKGEWEYKELEHAWEQSSESEQYAKL